MRCPICKKPVEPDSPYMPFCSDRCKLIDLANWADEKYRIPDKTPPVDESEATPRGVVGSPEQLAGPRWPTPRRWRGEFLRSGPEEEQA